MNENEIMNTENEEEQFEIEVVDECEKKTGLPTGLAMIIGSGITVAAYVAVKKLKRLWGKRKEENESVAEVGTVEAEVVEAD